MGKPDWLNMLEEEDPGCKEGFYIGIPPSSEDLRDDDDPGIKWSWNTIEPGLLELIAWGPPPDPMEVGFLEALTSWECARIYVARNEGSNFRVAIVMDKLISDVFSNIGHLIDFPLAKKYINAWLRSYHPKLGLVLNGENQAASHGISLVWTRPPSARRNHWVLTSLLDMSDGQLTKARAAALTQDRRFKNIRYAHRNLLVEDLEYLTLQGQAKGLGFLAIEALGELAKKFANNVLEDTLDDLVGDYCAQSVGNRGVQSLKTSFRKPDLFKRFEESGP